MNIHESAEDYLEAIQLALTKPSVSVAMKRFRENGYIEMDGDGYITLLPPGEEIAQRIYGRHKLLTQFLICLGVGEAAAAADACKMEHDLSEETFSQITAFVQEHSGQP